MIINEALVGAVGMAIGGLLTLWWTKGVEAQVTLLRARKESNLEDLERTRQDLVKVNDAIGKLEQKWELCEQKHNECERHLANLSGRLEVIEGLRPRV